MSSPEKNTKEPLNVSMAEPDPPHFVLHEPISGITLGRESIPQTQLDRTDLHNDIPGRYDLPYRAVLPILTPAATFDPLAPVVEQVMANSIPSALFT